MALQDWVKTMVPRRTHSTLDGHPNVKEELHRCFPLLANTKPQTISFAAYNWTTRPSKISPAQRVEPCISTWVYNMAVSHSLFEEDGAFWFYIDTC